VSSAIGSIIVASAPADATEFTIPSDSESFLVALRKRLAADLLELNRELTHLFGAWVIQGNTIASIRIGPVQFSLRARWVSDAVAAGVLSESRAAQLLQYWQRGGTIDSDLAEGIDRFRSRGIADAVGPCPWVCEVRVFGHTHTRSQQKALLAAQIALATISLAWDTPSQQTTMSREHRSLLIEGRLVLMSPYDPSAGFNVGNAMQRNNSFMRLPTPPWSSVPI
jgi:hypothetical protein